MYYHTPISSMMAMNPSTSSCRQAIIQQNSGSEEDPQHPMIDQRKQKRMISNRESARRSRMRKQQHLDELMTEAANLRAENNKILTNLNVVSHNYMQLQEENAVLKSHATDLSLKLEYLNIALQCAGLINGLDLGFNTMDPSPMSSFDIKSWYLPSLSQPLTAAETINS